MKRVALAGGLALACVLSYLAWAANITPTPIVGPTETGEWSAMQQQVVDIARLKPGLCTATATGSGAAGGTETVTCNGAWAQITTVSLTIATIGALNTVTVTNSKVQAGDGCVATVDATGAAATSAVFVQTCEVSASTLTIILTNILAVSPAAPVKINAMVLTQGNPN